MSQDVRTLAGGFPPSDPSQWRALADEALAGAPFERLVRKTPGGIERGPLFTRACLDEASETGAPGAAPFIRGAVAARDPYLPWGVRVKIDKVAPDAANAVILEELQGGASEIVLHLDPAGRSGSAVRTLDELAQVLDGVMADLAPVHLAPKSHGLQYAALMAAWLDRSGLDPASVRGGLGLDLLTAPRNVRARGGEIARYMRAAWPGMRTLRVNAAQAHEAGGAEIHELACACSDGAEAMRTLIDAGLSADDAAASIEFAFAADADVHLVIAKLRAARRLWARVCEAFGVNENSRAMTQHVSTSARMLTRRDPYTNLVRNACAGFGAAAGGADSILVRPFTDAIGPATSFSRRLARNLQILLMEESHVGKTADPAGGGFLHETLGARLAQTSWTLFQDIETRGGLSACISSGWLQDQIASACKARIRDYAEGRENLIGVSAYPELDARAVDTGRRNRASATPDAPALEDQPFTDMIKAALSGGGALPGADEENAGQPHLTPVRFAEPFEALRDAADAFHERTGARPAAFLATLGPQTDYNARAGFAVNRLAAAGVESFPPQAHASLDDCATAFRKSGARLAVICGTDAAYQELAAALADMLKAAGAAEVWLAGRPSDLPAIGHFIHARSDSLVDGKRAHQVLGVE